MHIRQSPLLSLLALIWGPWLSWTAVSAEYTADDFGRLAREHPLVVAGQIRAAIPGEAEMGGLITVRTVLKNDLRNVPLKAGGAVVLKPTSNNLFWARAVIEYGKGQTGVWILDTRVERGKVQLADIVAHFAVDEATLAKPPAGQKAAPLEQWGAKDQAGQWAVVKVMLAPTYDTKGKLEGSLAVGTCLEVVKMASSTTGEVAVCRLLAEENGGRGDLVLRTADLNIFPGLLSKVDEKRKELVIHEAELIAGIAELTEDAIAQSAAGNPYYAEYRRIKASYDAFWKKVGDLQRQRDAARGSDRMTYADQLRAMKGEDVRLGMAYEAAKRKYETWRQKYAPQTVTTPHIQAAEKELADVRQQIRQLP